MERAQLSLRDMPEVERAAKCALPIVFTSLDHPDYPGIQGTSTAVRLGPDVVFLTAAHVLASNSDRTIVEVALGFQGEPVRSRIGKVLKPRPSDARYEAVCDFAVMFPQAPPSFVQGDSAAFDLARVARMDAAAPDSLFGVFGYPRAHEDRNVIDYVARSLTFGLHLAIAKYEGRSTIAGHHSLRVSTAEFGGPNGFSGGPVFRLLLDEANGTWTPVFAGMVTMGGTNRIQFIDVAFLGEFLVKEVFGPRPG